ncbi:MAG: hypothetical protein GF381_01850 [Candidatus Pacebacteria bacterium]|nr:hypothetical protein [Candidatus Paceibacterota bacterium]
MTDKSKLTANLSQLNQNLIQIEYRLKRMTSLRFNFFLALVKGLGYTLGGTIVLSIVIAILARVISTLTSVPIVEDIVDPELLQEIYQQ